MTSPICPRFQSCAQNWGSLTRVPQVSMHPLHQKTGFFQIVPVADDTTASYIFYFQLHLHAQNLFLPLHSQSVTVHLIQNQSDERSIGIQQSHCLLLDHHE